jgi:hypothetical protein
MKTEACVKISLRLIVVTSLACALAITPAVAQDSNSRIKSEIERLEKALKDKPISDPNFAEVGTGVAAGLKSARQALDAGHVYLSLETLGRAEDLLGGARVLLDKTPLMKDGLPAFESEWGAASLRLVALDKEAHDRKWEKAPVAIRALSEAAQGRSIPLLDGARGFATATGPKDGLFYMGQAEGEAEFAKFCNTLSFPSTKTAIPLRSYLPELQALQTRTNAAFQPPKSIDLHSRFISLNSAIKLAAELDSSRFYAGALYEYLEALRNYGMLDQSPLDASQQSRVKEDLAATRKKLSVSSNDDSIAQLFFERAESYTVHADASAPSADEWRSARIIVDQVLPAYYLALRAPATMQVASGKTVEITLVRWPYT